MSDDNERDAILDLISAHIESRAGMNPYNYISDWRDTEGRRAYNSERRQVLRDLHDARALLAAVRRRSISADDLKDALRSGFGGRLSYSDGKLSYCTGQYYPTEYRACACSVLALALRRYWRADGNDVAKFARGEFGRGIASRWFA